MVNYRRLVALGYYKGKPVYYDKVEDRLKYSDGTEIPTCPRYLMVTLLLITLPILRLMSQLTISQNSIIKYLLLIFCSLFSIGVADYFNKTQYKKLVLYDAYFSDIEFREYSCQQRKNNLGLSILKSSLMLSTFAFCILYIFTPGVVVLILYSICLFLIYLFISNNLHQRKAILERLEKRREYNQ